MHGDLTDENGLILTEEDYQSTLTSVKWKYWRTKMTSIFQMNRVIVIGHSLSDKNIKHVLEAAQKGASVAQPVIWLAPNVSLSDRQKMLDKYRIRVVPYEDKDGKHKNLVSLIQSISEFVPPRTIIRVKEQLDRVSKPTETNIAAAGFFVFNELCKRQDFDQKRIDIILSAIQAALPELNDFGRFEFKKALEVSGWPSGLRIDANFSSQVMKQSIDKKLFNAVGSEIEVNQDVLKLSLEKRNVFIQMRERFKNSMVLRIKKEFPDLVDGKVSTIAKDIETALIQYFKEGGLSLASILYSKGPQRTAPGSLLTFITAVSTKYDDILMRLAFFKVSIDAFIHYESVEIDYLGRLSQGFFAYHGLGVFGDAAIDRLKIAKNTVWLIDSDTQIRALALGSSANAMYRDSLSGLKNAGIRFFSTAGLMSETQTHLLFADRIIKENGQNSSNVIAAARGEVPYRANNIFLEGFIRWQAAGNPCNWGNYLYQCFGSRNYDEIDIKNGLKNIGVEVVNLEEWPGFDKLHYAEIEKYAKEISGVLEKTLEPIIDSNSDLPTETYRKAKPEAEVYNIVKRERMGDYHLISEKGIHHDSWFVSNTAILNIIGDNVVITWQPQSFISFASTLCNETEAGLATQAFERIILGLAQSGFNLLDEDTIKRVFGGIIEQAKLDIEGLRQEYKETLEKKYGEPIESVMSRIPASYLFSAVSQISTEIVQVEAEREKQPKLKQQLQMKEKRKVQRS